MIDSDTPKKPVKPKKPGDSPCSQPRPGVPLDKEKILELVFKHSGNLSRVADALGSTRTSVRRRIDDDETLKEALAEARERKIDELEEAVIDRAIRTNDTGIQCFLLKTQARGRGYNQDDKVDAAKEIASAAFEFIIKKAQEQKPE